MFYKTIRSKRKTIALEISTDAVLIVRAPQRTTAAQIEKLVQEKIEWITKNLKIMSRKKSESMPKQFVKGEKFLYLGRWHELDFISSGRKKIYFENKLYLPKKYHSEAEKLFEKWFKSRAKEIIGKRAEHFANLHKLEYDNLRITSANKRWGSCSGKNLNFSWRLVMAPLEVIDYVVAHELAHLAYKNHSKRFWQKVAQICPDFKARRKWLRENGHQLSL